MPLSFFCLILSHCSAVQFNKYLYKGKAEQDECDPHGGQRIFDPVNKINTTDVKLVKIIPNIFTTDEVQM